MPDLKPPRVSAGERETLQVLLQYQRDSLIRKITGAGEAAARQSVVGFTDRARRVVVLAQEEARMLNHNYIGIEHILLGDVLKTMGIQLLNVTISTMAGRIFDGYLSLSNHRTVGARPSDAIALAIRTGAPILVSAELLDEIGISIPDDEFRADGNRSHEEP